MEIKSGIEYLEYVDSNFIKEDGTLDVSAKAKWIKNQLKDLKR